MVLVSKARWFNQTAVNLVTTPLIGYVQKVVINSYTEIGVCNAYS